jgi:hypothetical protein
VQLLIDMPRKRTISNRESKQPNWVGGNSGRFHFQDTNWNFNEFCHAITPIPASNGNEVTSNNSINSDVEAESSVDVEEENTRVSSSDCSSAESLCTNDSGNVTRTHNGSIIVNLPCLESTIISIACCKWCAKKSTYTAVEDFVDFCEAEQQQLLQAVQSMGIGDEVEQVMKKIDVRRFFDRWKTKLNSNLTGTVPIHIREPNTYGVATSFELQCNRCDTLGNGSRWKWRNHIALYEPVQRNLEVLPTKSDLCKYDINLRLCLALQLMGV